MSSNDQSTSAPVIKQEVTPLMKRRLMTAISDHWATKQSYTDETLFYADLGKLHAQLSGDLAFELKDFKAAVATVYHDEKAEATTTAYFTASIRDMRAGKWILNRALELDYLPQSRRIVATDHIRYSIPRISKRVANHVFAEHKDIFLKLEFLDDLNQDARAEKKSRKVQEVVDVFAQIGPALPDFPITEGSAPLEESITDQEVAELFEEKILEEIIPETKPEIIQNVEEEEIQPAVLIESKENVVDDLSDLLDI